MKASLLCLTVLLLVFPASIVTLPTPPSSFFQELYSVSTGEAEYAEYCCDYPDLTVNNDQEVLDDHGANPTVANQDVASTTEAADVDYDTDTVNPDEDNQVSEPHVLAANEIWDGVFNRLAEAVKSTQRCAAYIKDWDAAKDAMARLQFEVFLTMRSSLNSARLILDDWTMVGNGENSPWIDAMRSIAQEIDQDIAKIVSDLNDACPANDV